MTYGPEDAAVGEMVSRWLDAYSRSVTFALSDRDLCQVSRGNKHNSLVCNMYAGERNEMERDGKEDRDLQRNREINERGSIWFCCVQPALPPQTSCGYDEPFKFQTTAGQCSDNLLGAEVRAEVKAADG